MTSAAHARRRRSARLVPWSSYEVSKSAARHACAAAAAAAAERERQRPVRAAEEGEGAGGEERPAVRALLAALSLRAQLTLASQLPALRRVR